MYADRAGLVKVAMLQKSIICLIDFVYLNDLISGQSGAQR